MRGREEDTMPSKMMEIYGSLKQAAVLLKPHDKQDAAGMVEKVVVAASEGRNSVLSSDVRTAPGRPDVVMQPAGVGVAQQVVFPLQDLQDDWADRILPGIPRSPECNATVNTRTGLLGTRGRRLRLSLNRARSRVNVNGHWSIGGMSFASCQSLSAGGMLGMWACCAAGDAAFARGNFVPSPSFSTQ